MEGSYAHHYTTDAGLTFGVDGGPFFWPSREVEETIEKRESERDFKKKNNVLADPLVTEVQNVTAVTRIRTWVTAATTQGPNH